MALVSEDPEGDEHQVEPTVLAEELSDGRVVPGGVERIEVRGLDVGATGAAQPTLGVAEGRLAAPGQHDPPEAAPCHAFERGDGDVGSATEDEGRLGVAESVDHRSAA